MSDLKRIKFGVLGAQRGCFVLSIARLIPDEMVVTGVCDSDKTVFTDRVKGLFTEETKIYDSFDEMINSGIDAVVLCNYFHQHAEYAIKAMEAGVAVFSETTAAVSLGECVDLVEAAERTNGRYVLAANCPYIKPVHAMKKKIEEKVYGDVVYADAEYVHRADPGEIIPGYDKPLDLNDLHWRKLLPPTYYNMHTLGPLMYISGSVPVKVVGKAVTVGHDPQKKVTNGVKSFVITEMDNGAVFNTTGCVGVGTSGKWYRVACENGTMETPRHDGLEKLIETYCSSNEMKTTTCTWDGSGTLSKEDAQKYDDKIAQAGHGGIDFILLMHFIKYLRGEEEAFFDVYRSVALSAAGILAWYSVLSGSVEMNIPDFRKKEDRDKVRGDYRSPFAAKYSDITLPCKVGEPFTK